MRICLVDCCEVLSWRFGAESIPLVVKTINFIAGLFDDENLQVRQLEDILRKSLEKQNQNNKNKINFSFLNFFFNKRNF